MNNQLKCVVLCAGKGLRIYPYSEEIPKVLIEIKNKPVLGYVIDYWKKYTNNFIFVVGYKKEQVINYVKTLNIKAQFVEQKELKGIADAISFTEKIVSERFMVVLGDCFYDGEFSLPDDLKLGVGVYKTKKPEEIKQNYSIELKDNNVSKVIEKPKKIINDLCGMGIYFFDKRVFKYIKETEPSKLRNEVEITDVIQNMIQGGEEIKPLFFEGNYVNVTFPYDVIKTEEYILIKEKQFFSYVKTWGLIFWPIMYKLIKMRAIIVGDQIIPYINEGDKVLGFGCGKNIHHLTVYKYITSIKKINLTCIDIVQRDNKTFEFIKYEGGRLPFKNNEFDVVFSSIALHHTDNADFYLKELIRVSKKKIIICEDTYSNKLEEFIAKLVCNVADLIAGDIGMRRSFKSVEEWIKACEINKVKITTFKRYYPHPIPWIPTRNVIIELEK